MTAQAQQLVEQALTFPLEERQAIASALLRSVPADEPPQFSAGTLAKIEDIRLRYHAGEEATISGEEFKAHLEQLREKFRAQDQGAHIV